MKFRKYIMLAMLQLTVFSFLPRQTEWEIPNNIRREKLACKAGSGSLRSLVNLQERRVKIATCSEAILMRGLAACEFTT